MANLQTGPLLGFIHGLAAKSPEEQSNDRELLRRFASRRDEAAFAALVHRHGPMVLHVAQRVLHQRQDAEDVFQAAFLVLARKAERLEWRDSIANWLYEVAYRLACEVRAAACRRQANEKKVLAKPAADPLADISLREALVALDEELIRLPARLRLPMVLCCLEGATQEEAARKLGWSLATFKRRLVRGRELLHARLAGRGLTLAAALAALEFSNGAGTAAAPTVLVGSTAQAALAYMAGRSLLDANTIRAARLAQTLLKNLLLTKVKMVVALAALCLCTAGLGVAWQQTRSAQTQDANAEHEEARAAQANLQAPPKPADQSPDALPEGAVARLGTLQLRKGSGIFRFAPDGQTFLTLDNSRTLRKWDTHTGRVLQLHHLPPGKAFADSLSTFTHDAKRLIARSTEGFDLFDLSTYQRILSLPMEAPMAFRVAISPDDRTFAALENSGGHGVLRIWDLATGSSRVVGDHKGGIIIGVAFTPESKRIVTVDQVGTHCWDIASGRSIWHNKERLHERPIFLPDGQSFLGVHFPNHAVRRWDANSGEPIDDARLPNVDFNSSFSLSPNGPTLAVVTLEKGLRFWNLKTGAQGPLIKDVTECFDFAADGKTVLGATASALGRWEVATGRALYPDTNALGHIGTVNALSFTQDGKRLVSASRQDQTIRFWDVAARKPVFQIRGAKIHGDVIALMPDGKQIAGALSGVHDYGLVQIWDATTGETTKQLSARKLSDNAERVILSALKFSPDGKTLFGLSGVDDDIGLVAQAVVVAWDLSSGRQLFRRDIPVKMTVKSVSPDGSFLLGSDGHLVETESGKQILDLKTSFDVAADLCIFSPDQSLLAGTQCESYAEGLSFRKRMRGVRIWEVASGKLLARFETTDWLDHLAFAPDGLRLIATDTDAIRIWEVATGREIARHANTGNIHDEDDMMFYASSLAVSPDGKTLASGHADTTILLWNLPPLQPTHAKPMTATELNDSWSIMAGDDAKRAFAAIANLAASPAQTVRFLQDRLKPAVAAPAERVRQLIADLDSANFGQREAAQEHLVEHGELAEPALRERLKQSPSAEQRRRLEQILSTPAAPITPDALRSLRAIQVLERIGSPDARRLLQTLAAGAPEAKLTQLAKGSLERISRALLN